MTIIRPDDSNAIQTEMFFQKAYPNPEYANFRTQLGVHFEEIAEMVNALEGVDAKAQLLLKMVHDVNHAVAIALKTGEIDIGIKNRIEFLDGLCDQIVTAVGTGYMANMRVPEAFGEVNQSNLSKFDENGQPILDQNLKLMKGPNYRKPNLSDFV